MENLKNLKTFEEFFWNKSKKQVAPLSKPEGSMKMKIDKILRDICHEPMIVNGPHKDQKGEYYEISQALEIESWDEKEPAKLYVNGNNTFSVSYSNNTKYSQPIIKIEQFDSLEKAAHFASFH